MGRRSTHPGIRLYRRQRQDGVTWYARVQPRGAAKPKHVNLTDLGLRTERARVLWAEEESRRLQVRRHGLGPSLTLREGLAAYHEDLARDEAAPTTRKNYRAVGRQLERLLGPLVPLDRVRPQALWDLRRALIRGEPRASNSRMGMVARILEVWRRQGLVPLLDRDVIRDAFARLRVPRERPRWLSREEIAALLEAAGDDPLPRFLLLTGMRVGEAAGLTWDEVDLPGRAIRLTARTKTRRARDVELRVCPSVEDWLADLSRAGAHVFARRSYKGATERLVPRLREAVPGVVLKDLRSTCASYLHSAPGIPLSPHQRAAQLGHSLVIAERHYAGVVRDLPRDADTLELAMGLEARAAGESLGGDVIRLA